MTWDIDRTAEVLKKTARAMTKPRYRVAWYPQIPCKPFHFEVGSPLEGATMLRALAEYDAFLLANHHRVDYANTGSFQVFDPEDTTDGPDGSWYDWTDDDGLDVLEHFESVRR